MIRSDFPGDCHKVTEFEGLERKSLDSVKQSEEAVLVVLQKIDTGRAYSAQTKLCQQLVLSGCRLLILFCDGSDLKAQSWFDSLGSIDASKHELLKLAKQESIHNSPIADVLSNSFHLASWLTQRTQKFASILCISSPELLFYHVQARKTGLTDRTEKIVLFVESCLHFDIVTTSAPILSLGTVNLIYAQKTVCEYAHSLLSNSQHLLNWISNQSYTEKTDKLFFHQVPFAAGTDHTASQEFQKKLLVGETERKSGIVFVFGDNADTEVAFCIEAINRFLSGSEKFSFIFLSNPKRAVLNRIKEMSAFKAGRLNFYTQSRLQKESLDATLFQLASFAKLVIFPKLEGVDGGYVSRLKHLQIPVLCNDIVQREQSGPSIRSFAANPRLNAYWIEDGLEGSEPKLDDCESAAKALIDLLYGDSGAAGIEFEAEIKSTVTVCISHYNRGKMLLQAIESIQNQSFSCEEIIIVDDDSSDVASLAVLDELTNSTHSIPIRVIRQASSYVGASRNVGLQTAGTDYVLFMDDDNLAQRDELEVFMRAAQLNDADIFTCLSSVFNGSDPSSSSIPLQTALFVGANYATSLYANHIGDSNMMVKVASVREIGGFSEYYKTGRDDQEFFVRANENGLKATLIPTPLYFYRLSKDRMRNTHVSPYGGLARVMQSKESMSSFDDALALRFAQGLSFAAGPFGASSYFISLRNKIIELLRVYLARFPFAYKILNWLRKRFT